MTVPPHRSLVLGVLLPLLAASCPILRMSAVYALGRNPSPQAVEPLLMLLAADDNGYVRKAVAWSLSSYPDAPVMNPLIRALETDIAAVRLWAASALAAWRITAEGVLELRTPPGSSLQAFFEEGRFGQGPRVWIDLPGAPQRTRSVFGNGAVVHLILLMVL